MITVVNTHDREASRGAEYIGRGSPLGNPFKLVGAGGTYTRDDSVATYEQWLRKRIAERDSAVCTELNRLFKLARQGSLKLRCFCAPKRCHGDVIKQVLEEALAKLPQPEN